MQAESVVLHRLSDAANRSVDPSAIFEAALDAIVEILGVPRCSILTFDDAGVMRFRAWRGLSDEYRRAVDGHSPWRRGEVGAQPLQVEDVFGDPSLAGYRSVFEHECVRALAFIPLVYGDRVVGKFMLYANAPRRWDPAALERAGAIASQVASAVGRAEGEQALQDASRRKDEFLAMLSHELRNPLGAVRNALHVLRQAADDDVATRRRVFEIVDRQSANLSRMIDDLLDVSRITRGRVELKRDPTDLREVARRAAAAAAPLLAGHRLELRLPDREQTVDGDPVRLEQVITNLLSNAGRYTPAGGEVLLSLRQDGGHVVLEVTDTGIGIEAPRLTRVFDLFEQGHHDLARTQGGLGIGLTVVRGLVEMHGGSVSAASAGAGKGSTFTVRLPRMAAVASPSVEPAEPAPTAAGSIRRVLVVDDHAEASEMLAAMLGAWGHAVEVETDGSQVLSRVRSFQPEVVLLDIGLPGKDGYELAAEIRADTALHHVHLVALTGYGQRSDRERALESGFAEHLVKPVAPGSLRNVLDRLPAARGA
jgi:signal transduction histidine kinase